MKKIIVRTEGLKKYYPVGGTVVKALDGVDLEIREREFVSVIAKVPCCTCWAALMYRRKAA